MRKALYSIHFLALFLGLFTGVSYANITAVAGHFISAGPDSGGTNVTSKATGNIPGGVTAGKYIIATEVHCGAFFDCSTTSVADDVNEVTDTVGSTYIRCGTNAFSGSGLYISLWLGKVAATGADSVTMIQHEGGFMWGTYVQAVEVDGIPDLTWCSGEYHLNMSSPSTTPGLNTRYPVPCGSAVLAAIWANATGVDVTNLGGISFAGTANTVAQGIASANWTMASAQTNMVIGVVRTDDACNNGVDYYVDFTGGADTNTAITTGSPLKHAPGMQGCSDLCANITPQPNDKFYLRKGVTWDHTALPWYWDHWAGLENHEIYVGVKAGWNSGDDNVKPVLDLENESSIGQALVLLGGPENVNTRLYLQVDKIEAKNVFVLDTNQGGFVVMSCARNLHLTNMNVHGWLVDPMTLISPPEVDQSRDGLHGGIIGYYTNCSYEGTYVSGAEIHNEEGRDAGVQNGLAMMDGICVGCYIHDVGAGINKGIPINSRLENIYSPGGCGVVGSNQSFGGCDSRTAPPFHEATHDDTTYILSQGTSFMDEAQRAWSSDGMAIEIYGNTFKNIANSAPGIYLNGPCGIWRVYNNVFVNSVVSDPVGWDSYINPPTPQPERCGEVYLWNNTFEDNTTSSAIMRIANRGTIISVLEIKNNHFIGDKGYWCNGCRAETIDDYSRISVFQQTHAEAATAGYSSSNNWAPTSSSSITTNSPTDHSATNNGIAINVVGSFVISTDINGVIRPQGSSPKTDVGAFQFTPFVNTGNAGGSFRLKHH